MSQKSVLVQCFYASEDKTPEQIVQGAFAAYLECALAAPAPAPRPLR